MTGPAAPEPRPAGRDGSRALAINRAAVRRQVGAVRDWRRCRAIYCKVLDVGRILAAEEAELRRLWRRYAALTRRSDRRSSARGYDPVPARRIEPLAAE